MGGRSQRLRRAIMMEWRVEGAAARPPPGSARPAGARASGTGHAVDPGRGRTKTGQLWVYARDDRPCSGTDPPAVAYVYAADRKAERPIAHLAGFTGVL